MSDKQRELNDQLRDKTLMVRSLSLSFFFDSLRLLSTSSCSSIDAAPRLRRGERFRHSNFWGRRRDSTALRSLVLFLSLPISRLRVLSRLFLFLNVSSLLFRFSARSLSSPPTPKNTQIPQSVMAKLGRASGRGGSTTALNNVLMQMRKNCNHPDLITSAFTRDVNYPPPDVLTAQSGKLALLHRLLTRLRAGGHKVLIFSQMTKMLDLLESYLEQSGHSACRLDGGIPYAQRAEAIESFNADPNTWLFLLSTRAGGLGINLTAADTVIIYDSDWNPSADLQAMDRCHRIGQTRPVLVFRLATSHSVEGKMLRRACDKMALERMVIRKGVFKEVLDMGGAGGEGGEGGSAGGRQVRVLRPGWLVDDVCDGRGGGAGQGHRFVV